MPPERRSERNWTALKVYEGGTLERRRTAKRKEAEKQPARRKRQQSISKAERLLTDADHVVEAVEQLVALKRFVSRQKISKTAAEPTPEP
jgi:3-hydroxyacyl-CoA dehydrogenase